MLVRNLVLAGAGVAALLAASVPAHADDWRWRRDEWRGPRWHEPYRPSWRPYYRPWAYAPPPPVYYAPPPPRYYAPPPPAVYFGFNGY